MFSFPSFISFLIIIHNANSESLLTHTLIHRIQDDHRMIKQGRSDPNLSHEVVFSIQQRNIDTLEQMVNDRSDPHSPNYQQWLSVEEIQTMTENKEGFDHVMQWLNSNSISTDASPTSYSHYIKASAPISLWESLFDIQFYEWHHHNADSESPVTVHRSEELKLPDSMIDHVFTVFNTCQAMPVIKHHGHVREAEKPKKPFKSHMIFGDLPAYLGSFAHSTHSAVLVTETQTVTVSFLDSYYYIPSNKGTPLLCSRTNSLA